MKLTDVSKPMRDQLDLASDNLFTSLENYCLDNDCEVYLNVQTRLEGLEKGQMKLFVQIVDDGDTLDYAVINLREGSAQLIGWNIYLDDVMESAKSHLASAHNNIRKAAEAEKLDRQELRD